LIAAIPFILLFITFIFPVKFTIRLLPVEDDSKFYIIRFVSDPTNSWILIGDNTGLYDRIAPKDFRVYLEGSQNPQEIVSGDLYLWDAHTHFIVWGELTPDTVNAMAGTIYCTRWEIYGIINSRRPFRNRLPKNYLTIWDYRWFDDFRRWIGIFDE